MRIEKLPRETKSHRRQASTRERLNHRGCLRRKPDVYHTTTTTNFHSANIEDVVGVGRPNPSTRIT
jgi:hypothetical protein